MIKVEVTDSDREEMFNFLYGLRASGEVNMFGAAPYLSEMFDIPKNVARRVLSDWMEQF
jgi:hypothetical protein